MYPHGQLFNKTIIMQCLEKTNRGILNLICEKIKVCFDNNAEAVIFRIKSLISTLLMFDVLHE